MGFGLWNVLGFIGENPWGTVEPGENLSFHDCSSVMFIYLYIFVLCLI